MSIFYIGCLIAIVWFMGSFWWILRNLGKPHNTDPDRWYDFILSAPFLLIATIIAIFRD